MKRRSRSLRGRFNPGYLGRPGCPTCGGCGWAPAEPTAEGPPRPDGKSAPLQGFAKPCGCRQPVPPTFIGLSETDKKPVQQPRLDRRRLASGEREEDIA